MSGIIGKREARGSGIVDGQVPANADIDHDSLGNFASNEHYTQANITALGTVASGTLGSAVVFPAGVITNFENFEYSTRQALLNSGGEGAGLAFPGLAFSYDKKQSGSTLFVQARIRCFGTEGSSVGAGFTYGDSANIWCGGYNMPPLNFGFFVIIQGVLTSHTETDTQTLTMIYGGGDASRPADFINPTSGSDGGQLPATTRSTVFVWEVL